MYSWGYLKNVALAKLDLTEDEATNQGLLTTFPYYANEVITQVSSTIKPNNKFAEFVAVDREEDLTEGKYLVGVQCQMPADFIGFGDDVNERTYQQYGARFTEEASDENFRYVGYNRVMFKKPGTYQISYKARWIDFSQELAEDDVLDVPADILECIPSYIASQCFKIDDQHKSQVFRNEYEIFFARIDDTDYKNTKNFVIGGDW
jgi:hypothetical protein